MNNYCPNCEALARELDRMRSDVEKALGFTTTNGETPWDALMQCIKGAASDNKANEELLSSVVPERDDLRISLASASDALRIHADLNGELSGRYQNAIVKIDTLMDRLVEADRVIALSQLCCITTGAQGCEYQTALDAYKTGAL